MTKAGIPILIQALILPPPANCLTCNIVVSKNQDALPLSSIITGCLARTFQIFYVLAALDFASDPCSQMQPGWVAYHFHTILLQPLFFVEKYLDPPLGASPETQLGQNTSFPNPDLVLTQHKK